MEPHLPCRCGFSLFLMDIFVTGTDTGVGKTLIAQALIAGFAEKGKKVLGMKPVASGQDRDLEKLMHQSTAAAPQALLNPYAYEAPISPHLAESRVNESIDISDVAYCYRRLKCLAEVVIVEGAGGILCPLNEKQTMLDLAIALGLPIIMVVGLRLGCLNHALLTECALLKAGLTVQGWVANHLDAQMLCHQDNIETLQCRLQAPFLGTIPYGASVSHAKKVLFQKN